MSKFKLLRSSVLLVERKVPSPVRVALCLGREFLQRVHGVGGVQRDRAVMVSRALQSRVNTLEIKSRGVTKFGGWSLDKLLHLGFLTLAGCLGYTCVSMLGYSACVSALGGFCVGYTIISLVGYPVCVSAVAGFCVGYTCISMVGYPACVSGKSMQPSFNPKPRPTVWTFYTASPPEDPFCNSSWEENTWWTLREGESDVVMDLWIQDWVWVSTWRARKFDLSQGDVVVYNSPKDPCDYIIKRVIALEGDIVSSDRYHQPHVRIPEGHLWLEGDNWDNSVDSNKYGPVSKGLVFGVASHIVWPPSRWQRLNMEVLDPRLHPERVISSAI